MLRYIPNMIDQASKRQVGKAKEAKVTPKKGLQWSSMLTRIMKTTKRPVLEHRNGNGLISGTKAAYN